ncbi:hypothetical protein [Actinoplanes sp. NBRC 103695]|uniref:hypothetical protein n=1 Tax=Actinoplanes sp. NBRC 103695 TaxID=3032202 RepID=UPI00255709B1|nr:hypothetical protein [Actinoplanes sp. NBRC 103695]
MAKKHFTRNDFFWERRAALGLSRPEVADIANGQPVMGACEHVPLDENYIGRVEQGRVGGGMCEERLASLCTALQVDNPAMIGLIAERRTPTSSAPPRQRTRIVHNVASRELPVGPADEDVPRVGDLGFADSDFMMKRRRVVAGLVSPAIAALIDVMVSPFDRDPPNAAERPIEADELAAAVSQSRRAYQHSEYAAASATLPTVFAGIRSSKKTLNDRRLAALEAEAYQVASGLLLKGGKPVLAAVAAERCTAAAERTGDEVLIACGARAFTHCLMASGHAREGVRLAISAADRLSASVNMDQPAAMSVYGALLLRGAIAAAREEDRDQAYELLNFAAGTAEHLGMDGNLLWTAFGPTNVTAHRVAVAVELGDAGSAVAYAKEIDLAALKLPERKAMVLLDTARAYTQWGKADNALGAIRQAERYAPEEVRRRPAVHQLIDELAQRSPAALRRRVQQYAARVRTSA